MKIISRFLGLLFLVSCSSPQPATQVVEVTSTSMVQSPPEPASALTLSITPTLLSTISPTDTPIPCDPHVADYCITEGHFLFRRPIFPPGNDSVDGTYRFASTANGTRDPHHGVEFLNRFGTSVHAAGDGIVLYAGLDIDETFSPWKNFYGNVIVIRHADDLYTLYAHLSRIDVHKGERVTVGEKIGEVGQSGVATGSHLHFEVRLGDAHDYGASQNPELWLVPEINDNGVPYGVVVISIMDEKSRLQAARLTLTRAPAFPDDRGTTYYLDTYAGEMAVGDENAAMSDLPPGRYRIALEYNGHWFDRRVEVESGKLTQVVFVVK